MQGREAGLTTGGGPLAPAGLSGRNFLGENALSAAGSRNSGLTAAGHCDRSFRSLLFPFYFSALDARLRRKERLHLYGPDFVDFEHHE